MAMTIINQCKDRTSYLLFFSLVYYPPRLVGPDSLTLSQTTNFRPFQTVRLADDNFKFDEKFSTQVENTVGKGEIARYEQFLLFPQ